MRGLTKSVTVAVMSVVLPVTACGGGPSATSHGDPVRDHASLVDALRARDMRVDIVGTATQPILRPTGTRLKLSGGSLKSAVTVESFNYDTTDLGEDAAVVAKADAARIGADGGADAAHVFLRDRVVVLYGGSDQAGLAMLTALLGAEVTGRT